MDAMEVHLHRRKWDLGVADIDGDSRIGQQRASDVWLCGNGNLLSGDGNLLSDRS